MLAVVGGGAYCKSAGIRALTFDIAGMYGAAIVLNMGSCGEPGAMKVLCLVRENSD